MILLTIGYNRQLLTAGKAILSMGSQATFYRSSSKLDDLYGNGPVAYQVFFRINPGLMKTM